MRPVKATGTGRLPHGGGSIRMRKRRNMDSTRLKSLLAFRAKALARFEKWRALEVPVSMSAEEAIAAVGFLYELLPFEARKREWDPTGVARMHAALSVMGGDHERP